MYNRSNVSYFDQQEAGLVLIRNADSSIQLVTEDMLDDEGNIKTKIPNKNKLNNQSNDGDRPLVNGLTNGNGHATEDEQDDVQEETPLYLSNNISLISRQAASMIADVDGKTLEVKLYNLINSRKVLQDEVSQLCSELDEERQRYNTLNDSIANSSLHLTSEMQNEIQRNIDATFRCSLVCLF